MTIEDHLQDWEILFEKMGYHLKGTSLVLQNHVKWDLLIDIAFQCYLASIELRIMHEIYQKVKASFYSVKQVFECRFNTVGDVKMCAIWIYDNLTPSQPKEPSVQDETLMRKPYGNHLSNSYHRNTDVLQTHGQHGYDKFEDLLEETAMAECDLDDIYSEGTTDEHLAKSMLYVLRGDKVANQGNSDVKVHSQLKAERWKPPPSTGEWEDVRQGLIRKYGEKYYDGERGDLLKMGTGKDQVTAVRKATPEENLNVEVYDNIHEDRAMLKAAKPFPVTTPPLLSHGCPHDVTIDGTLGPDDLYPEASISRREPRKLSESGYQSQSTLIEKRKLVAPSGGSRGNYSSQRKSMYDNVPSEELGTDYTDATNLALPKSSRSRSPISPSLATNFAMPPTKVGITAQDPQSLPRTGNKEALVREKLYSLQVSNHSEVHPASQITRTGQAADRSSAVDAGRDRIKDLGRPPQDSAVPSTDSGRNGNGREPQRSLPSSSSTGNIWQCASCTFANPSDSVVCSMCSRSRHQGGDKPLKTGGHECQSCTFVNESDATHCQVCDKELVGCPTYI